LKKISCMETRLELAEFCVSSCLSRMVKMEVCVMIFAGFLPFSF